MISESNLFLLHVDIQFSQHHLLKRLFFLLGVLGTVFEDLLTINVWVYLWHLCSVLLVYLFALVRWLIWLEHYTIH